MEQQTEAIMKHVITAPTKILQMHPNNTSPYMFCCGVSLTTIAK